MGRGSDLPVVTRRTTSNTVIVKDGGTVAIAGLSQNNRTITHKKVPGLGDLPMIGALFNNDEDDKAQKEVAVFVTARLIGQGKALGRLESNNRQTRLPQMPDYSSPIPRTGPGIDGSNSREDFRRDLYESISRNRGRRR
jgi:type II secretory pathway component GspD/PulD (secretin)